MRAFRLVAFVVAAVAIGCGSDPGSAEPLDGGADATAADSATKTPHADANVDDATLPADSAAADANVGDATLPGDSAAADANADDATADSAADANGDDAAPDSAAADASHATGTVSVLTQHNDVARTGANLAETVLTTANVNTDQFGKLFCRSVDDQIYTQPLVVANVAIAGVGARDVVYVATMNDSVYAFDANDPAAAAPLWSRSFLGPGVVPVKNTDMTGACGGNYTDISGNIGVLGTPVIDPATSTMYLVARTKENGGSTFVQKLHALDITDGSERPGSPTTITASVVNRAGAVISFDPLKENQRSSLLLSNGVVYIGYASHCDWGPYHGWLLGYGAGSLQQVMAYNTTPDGESAGIWMSGQGPSADSSGSIYLATGNGSVGTANNAADPKNRGESLLRLTPSGAALTVASWFTPHDYRSLEAGDLDLGSGGVLLVPDTNLAVAGGKGSKVYAVDRTAMGGLSVGRTEDPSVQVVALDARHLHGAPVYWKSPAAPLIYAWAEYDHLKAFRVDTATSKLDPVPFAMSPAPAPDGMPGGMLSISANASVEGTGILWVNIPYAGDANNAVVPGELRAFDAANVGVELWNSAQNAPRDSFGSFAKFTSPTVANGYVYLATFSDALCVYGLLPNVTPLGAPTGLTATATSKTSAALQWVANSTTETSFAIERREPTSGFAPLASAAAGTTSFVDATALPFASYTYRVRALGAPAPSAYSNTANVVMNAGAPAPRLRVEGAGRAIALGSSTPSWTTDTDFGGVTAAPVSRTFTIENIGNAALDLSGPVTISGAGAAAFSIATAPASTVAAGATTTFAVVLAPTAPGLQLATIQIVSDDPDQSPFTFAVGGRDVGDILGWWKLDETTGAIAADSSGQGNHGAAVGVTWAAGHTGGAGSFDGAGSYVSVPENASLDPYALTVAAWVNPVDWAGNRRILQKGANDDQYRFLAEGGVLKLDVAGAGNVTTTLPPTGVWTHVAATYDQVALRLYVNGILVATKPATNPMNATSDPLFIGTKGVGSSAGDHWNGLLDEVHLYGRALTATEIAALAH